MEQIYTWITVTRRHIPRTSLRTRFQNFDLSIIFKYRILITKDIRVRNHSGHLLFETQHRRSTVSFDVHQFSLYRFDISDPLTFSPPETGTWSVCTANFCNTMKLNIYPRLHTPRRSIAYKYLSGVVSLVIPREMDATWIWMAIIVRTLLYTLLHVNSTSVSFIDIQHGKSIR